MASMDEDEEAGCSIRPNREFISLRKANSMTVRRRKSETL